MLSSRGPYPYTPISPPSSSADRACNVKGVLELNLNPEMIEGLKWWVRGRRNGGDRENGE